MYHAVLEEGYFHHMLCDYDDDDDDGDEREHMCCSKVIEIFTSSILPLSCMLLKGDEERTLEHTWYNTWPDHGVPRTSSGHLNPAVILGRLLLSI